MCDYFGLLWEMRSNDLANMHLYSSFFLFRSLSNGIYKLKNNNSLEQYKVYCHMANITGCGKGGWTLVMKVDGNKVNNLRLKINDIQ